jgi:Na+-driven multidrug efflux pump
LLPGTLFWGIYNVICSSIEGRGKPFLVSIISVFGGLLTLVLDAIIVSRLGAFGASIASSLSYLIVMIFSLFIYKKYIGTINVFPTFNDIKYFVQIIIKQAKKIVKVTQS